MSEIKPCPFCGSTSISIQEGSTFRWMLACCNDCDAKSGEIRVDTLNNRRADAPQCKVVELPAAPAHLEHSEVKAWYACLDEIERRLSDGKKAQG